jgi:hypothetical protein
MKDRYRHVEFEQHRTVSESPELRLCFSRTQTYLQPEQINGQEQHQRTDSTHLPVTGGITGKFNDSNQILKLGFTRKVALKQRQQRNHIGVPA